jgi:phosphatidylserine/phosphatidylglycerophosphate/cardiolipin synthase-like enzyme
VSAFSVGRVASCSEATVSDLSRLVGAGLTGDHVALLLDTCAERAELEASLVRADLVWTGPEVPGAHCRDTAIVLEELFSHAERDVFISTFVMHQVADVFRALARRMDAVPDLRVRLFLHVGRQPGDTTLEALLLREFADKLRNEWPGLRHPEVYYDPRGLAENGSDRATWHAKCVVVDDKRAFVTSANFTEWAQQRNVEAGVLVTGPAFARQVRQQFDGLVEARLVKRLAGF